ncbi:hypothetical protein PTKIN_Ptkin13bG0258200 [Pterospermum kingtungense]
MFRLHKTRPTKSGEKIDFKFSNFKAVQAPKGWDRLFMSIISMENGKTIAKTSKAVVRNGTCQWTETVSESIWVSGKKASKEMDDCLFKLVVAMGSARSSILGEATVNMTDYINSTATVPVSLPLKKCSHGTILHVKIHCLTPRPKPMDDESKQTNSDAEGDLSLKSDGPESISMTEKRVGASPTQDLDSGPAPLQRELESREASFSTSDSLHSYDSAESYIGRESLSSVSNLSHDIENHVRRQDSPTSQNNLPHDDLSQSNHSSFDSRTAGSQSTFSDNHQERVTDSSNNLLEAAEKTIEELHAEAKMWERNAQKLMLDLEILRKEYSDQSKSHANLDMELSAANSERDGLRKEVEQLKVLLESSMEKQATLEDSTVHDEGTTHVQKELENEIKFQKEANADLALQLKRSQDANAELVSVLQELEENIEKQRVEMENVSALQSQFSELENTIQINAEENKKLLMQLQQSRETEKGLQGKVQHLEKALKDKEGDIEEEYGGKLAAKEREIVGLKVKLSESLKERSFVNMESRKGGDALLIREIEALKAKLEELESDCNELTDENLELLLKLKEKNNNFKGVESTDFSSDELSAGYGVESSEDKSQLVFLEEKLKKKILREIQSDYNSYIQELESQIIELEAQVTEVGKELTQKRAEMQTLEATMKSHEEENVELRRNQSKLQTEVSNLQKEKDEISRSGNEMEAQKTDMEKQLQDMRDQWLASQEKCEYLRRENTELQETNEKVNEECNSLQKSAGDLRNEKSRLDEHCAYLEAKLRESDKSLAGCRRKVEVLEENLSLVIEDFASKEERLTSELDAIHDKSKKLEAKLKHEESSWNQMHLQKTNEVENLRQEVEKLAKQISEAAHEKEKMKLAESEMKKMEAEANAKVEDLLGELAACKENQETLMAEHEKALRLLEGYKSSEGKLRTIVNGLELKLTVSEYERQQVSEQSTNMKVQLLKLENLQLEILALRDECNAIKADKEKLEASLYQLSGECDDLKAEKNSFVVQISTLQKVVSELEGHKHEKVALEEKFVEMEGDLMAKEALLIQDGELKNELHQIKKTNRQFQQQIKQLQEEKDELLTKAQTLEENSKLKVEVKQKRRQSNSHSNQHKREVRDSLP